MPPRTPPVIGRLALPRLELSENELKNLWIHRARHLAQSVLHLAWIQTRENLPPPLVTMARSSTRLIMDNMVILARSSVEYGPYRKISIPKFFVPAEAVVLFALAEGFVDMFGFEGDGDADVRSVVFENMETLDGCMRLHPSFSFGRIDFPGFPMTAAQLAAFGVATDTSRGNSSVSLLNTARARHVFGQDLLRYNPSLGPDRCHKIAIGREILIPTRPNTPASPTLTVILEDSEGNESSQVSTGSGKESESGSNLVSGDTGLFEVFAPSNPSSTAGLSDSVVASATPA